MEKSNSTVISMGVPPLTTSPTYVLSNKLVGWPSWETLWVGDLHHISNTYIGRLRGHHLPTFGVNIWGQLLKKHYQQIA
jgi:hypothetical protein